MQVPKVEQNALDTMVETVPKQAAHPDYPESTVTFPCELKQVSTPNAATIASSRGAPGIFVVCSPPLKRAALV